MNRAPIESRPSTAQWLISEREAAGFSNAPDFLAAVKAKMGAAPSYSTYASWESGATTPRARNLKVIRDFHATRQGAKAPPGRDDAPDLATALLALAAELTALREERQAMARRVDDLEAQVAELVASGSSGPGTGAPSARDAVQA